MEENNLISWIVKGGRVIGPAPFLVAGILNVTPDSFFDGGSCNEPEKALARASMFLEQGAHVVDAGGESTRPFSARIDAKTEMGRVLPVVKIILEKHPHANVSIDTYKAEVGAACLDAGAVIINDVSACRFDPGLPDVLAEFKPGYVLMHSLGDPATMQGDPRYDDVVGEIKSFFHERLNLLVKKGLPLNRIMIDPGIGFGKTLEHNLEIMRRMDEFHSFGLPLFLGLSNKSLWGKLLGLDPGSRGMATQVALSLMAAKRVGVHRVHDVQSTFNSLKIFTNIWS
jgi:dihydropteroate synthase